MSRNTLPLHHALEYAQFAVALSKLMNKKMTEFSDMTSSFLLYQYRKKGKYSRAMEDYIELNRIGIRNASVENAIALISYEKPDQDLVFALEASERATTYDQTDPVLCANSAFFHYYIVGDNEEAYKRYLRTQELDPKFELKDPYLSSAALAAFGVFKEKPSSVDPQEVHQILRQARDLAMKKKHESLVSTLEAALVEFNELSKI